MQFMIVTRDNGSIEWSLHEQALRDEARHVWELHKSGALRNIWFTEDKDAILVIEANDKAEALSLMDGLPLVKAKLIRYSIHGLLPYTGFERILNGTD